MQTDILALDKDQCRQLAKSLFLLAENESDEVHLESIDFRVIICRDNQYESVVERLQGEN